MSRNPVVQNRPSDRPFIEPLEGRLQYAAFSAKVNFTTTTAPGAAHYTRDYGGVYTYHRNGLTYGWNDDHQSRATYKLSSYNDTRLDSSIAMADTDNWSIAVPNGYYKVHAVMGQAGVISGDQRLTAEGNLFISGQPYNGFAFIEGFVTVQVTDGKLTLAPNSRAVSAKLDYVEISQTTAPAVTPAATATARADTTLEVPVKRVEFSVARLGTKIYSLGGFVDDYTSTTQRFDVFDTKTLTYTQLTDLPGAPTHEAVATDGTYIYSAGGQFGPERSTDLTNVVWRYDIAHNSWSRFTKLPAIRTGGTLTYLDGKLHFIGGDDASRVRATNTHWTLDLSNPAARWTNAAPLPGKADHAAALTLNGVIYFSGGDNEHGTSYLSQTGLYAYDPDRDIWATFASLPTGISHAEAATITDGKNIFVIAGQGLAQQLTAGVYVYNIAKNVWRQSTSMPTARKGGVAWIAGSKFYYLTGDDSASGLQRGGYVGTIGD